MYTPEEIDYGLGDTGFVSEEARFPLAKALSYLPDKVVDFVFESCVFVSLDKECRGMHIGVNDFRLKKKQGIIILSDSIWSTNEKAIAFTIAHEVAHAYKRHGRRRLEDSNPILCRRREKAADKQATRWLSSHFAGSFDRYKYKSWQLS